jgi:glycerol dehydrogenase-like iron-containing ADH family enzyme
MMKLRASNETVPQAIREFVSVVMMSILIGGVFMAFMAFAWTVRTTAGALHLIRHPLSAFDSYGQQGLQSGLHGVAQMRIDRRGADEADA